MPATPEPAVPDPDLVHPFTPSRASAAVDLLRSLDALVTSPERLLAWNDVREHDRGAGCVVYRMARAQRGRHNQALDVAVAVGTALGLPVVCMLKLTAGPTGTELRHVEWMLRGLPDAFSDAAARGVHGLLLDYSAPSISEVLGAGGSLRPAIVVLDDDVMPRARRGRQALAASLTAPVISVDVDVVVPGAMFPRQQYAARTLRPRLHRVLESFSGDVGDPGDGSLSGHAPKLKLPLQVHDGAGIHRFDPQARVFPTAPHASLVAQARAAGVPAIAGLLPDAPSGTHAGLQRLGAFVDAEIDGYDARRNRPEVDGTSGLSPFLHFGQVGPAAVLETVRSSGGPAADVATFVEEFVVRRELAYNFVRWNPRAHQLAGADPWALRTLAEHARDPRAWSYEVEELEAGATHDPLWNASQHQLVETGHMHGYMRMYWAKKLLEWSASPSLAFDIALTLNDRWQLDGRDPNGIVGVAWAVAGVHDRAWTERPIFGKVRYMSLASTGRKFDSKRYIARWRGEETMPPADGALC